jgi:hypothetical protein
VTVTSPTPFLQPVAGVLRVTVINMFDPRQRQRIFPLTSASRPALRPTQPPIHWVPGAISAGVKRGRGVMLTTHPLQVPRLRKSRSYTSCHPDAPLWGVTGPLYLYVWRCNNRMHALRIHLQSIYRCDVSARVITRSQIPQNWINTKWPFASNTWII